MKTHPAIPMARRWTAAALLALAGTMTAATGAWNLVHCLWNHPAAVAAESAVCADPGPSHPDPPAHQHDCAVCLLLTSLMRLSSADLTPQQAWIATCSVPAPPSGQHRPAQAVCMAHSARAPPRG